MHEIFGPYTLLKRIAVGGMGEIFLSKQDMAAGFERYLVVKRILSSYSDDDKFVQMFLNEARLAALLNHPNIVQIFDFGQHNSLYFIAMEFLEGRDLRKIVKKLPNRMLPYNYVVHVVHEICSGLYFAHEKKDNHGVPLHIIHRDVSPQNIFVTFDGIVKLLDFGIAKAETSSIRTQTGVLKGKYTYMAPEMVAGKKIDARADIFSLGIILYEFSTGKNLFKRENELQILKAVLKCEIIPPTKVVKDYPPELEKIVLKALSKSPDQRYSNCLELQEDLENFMVAYSMMVSPKRLGDFIKGLFPNETQNLQDVLSQKDKDDNELLYSQSEEIIFSKIPSYKDEKSLDLNSKQDSVSEQNILKEKEESYDKLFPSPLNFVQPPLISEPEIKEENSSRNSTTTSSNISNITDNSTTYGSINSIVHLIKTQPVIIISVIISLCLIIPLLSIVLIYTSFPNNKSEDRNNAKLATKVNKDDSNNNKVLAAKNQIEEIIKINKLDSGLSDSLNNEIKVNETKEVNKTTLNIKVVPRAKIYLNNKLIGDGKVDNFEVIPGEYKLRFSNPQEGINYSRDITINEGTEFVQNFTIPSGFISVKVTPYAEVYVDGRSFGYTPMPPIKVYAGNHIVKFVNKELNKEIVRRVLIQGENNLMLKIHF